MIISEESTGEYCSSTFIKVLSLPIKTFFFSMSRFTYAPYKYLLIFLYVIQLIY